MFRLIYILFTFNFFINNQAIAQILLVPESTTDFENYQKACHKEGYICIMDYQIEIIKKEESKNLNDFLNQLDYSSIEFKKNFIQKVLNLIKSEQLSPDQIEMLAKVITQTKDFLETQERKQLSLIENQIQESLAFVRAHELKEPASQIMMIFKTPLSIKYLKKFKSNLLRLNWIQIDFNKSLLSQNDLIMGSCENSKIDESLENVKWQAYSTQSCGLTAEFSKIQKSSSSFLSENKNTLITTGIVLVGAALFFNKYEVKFNF
jgi:hypothetical protein